MENINFVASYEEAYELAVEIFGCKALNDNYDNERYGSCQCGCGESVAYYFQSEEDEDNILKIGICERCANL